MATIAIVGASANRAKFGNKSVRAYAARGWQVFPVHPSEREIEGHATFAKVSDIPAKHLDRVSLYLPESAAIPFLEGLASASIGELWLNPGADSPAVVQRARQLGLNVIRGCSIVDVGIEPDMLD